MKEVKKYEAGLGQDTRINPALSKDLKEKLKSESTISYEDLGNKIDEKRRADFIEEVALDEIVRESNKKIIGDIIKQDGKDELQGYLGSEVPLEIAYAINKEIEEKKALREKLEKFFENDKRESWEKKRDALNEYVNSFVEENRNILNVYRELDKKRTEILDKAKNSAEKDADEVVKLTRDEKAQTEEDVDIFIEKNQETLKILKKRDAMLDYLKNIILEIDKINGIKIENLAGEAIKAEEKFRMDALKSEITDEIQLDKLNKEINLTE